MNKYPDEYSKQYCDLIEGECDSSCPIWNERKECPRFKLEDTIDDAMDTLIRDLIKIIRNKE